MKTISMRISKMMTPRDLAGIAEEAEEVISFQLRGRGFEPSRSRLADRIFLLELT